MSLSFEEQVLMNVRLCYPTRITGLKGTDVSPNGEGVDPWNRYGKILRCRRGVVSSTP